MPARESGQLEERDRAVILDGLQYGAMCNEHLLAFSHRYSDPFPDESKIRKRTAVLQRQRLISTRYYSTKNLRNRAYHTLTAKGYRVLHGSNPPRSFHRLFRKISQNDQEHHYWMMHFYVKTMVAAEKAGIRFQGYVPENIQPISIYNRERHHDGRFRLQVPGILDFGFITEIDNHTESLESGNAQAKTVHEWMTTYLHFDKESSQRDQVLLVSVRGGERLEHLLELARSLNPNRNRNLFLGVDLPTYLASENPLGGPHARTEEGKQVSLLWYPDRLRRLLSALRYHPRTVKSLLRYSNRAAHPFTSQDTIQSDLRALYNRGLVHVEHLLRHGRSVYSFRANERGLMHLLNNECTL